MAAGVSGASPPVGSVVAACFIVAVFSWGFGFYAHGIYLVELQRAHGWSTSLLSTVVTVHYIAGALLLPFIHREQFRRCEVLRVMQLPGVIPALGARRLFGTPFVVTYGYRYGEVAHIAGSRVKPRAQSDTPRPPAARAAHCGPLR